MKQDKTAATTTTRVDDHFPPSISSPCCLPFGHRSCVEPVREPTKGAREWSERANKGSGSGLLFSPWWRKREEREPSSPLSLLRASTTPSPPMPPFFSPLSPLFCLLLLLTLHTSTAPDAAELCLRGVYPRRGHGRREGEYLFWFL